MSRDIFVGREAELRQLTDARLAAAAGNTTVLHISGPAGIGKTALLTKFLRERCADDLVLRATGDEIEQQVPFSILGQLLASVPASHRQLATCVADATSDVVSAGSRLVELISQLCLENTLLLVVDDAQWCDSATLQAVAFAARRLHSDAVLFVACTREEPGSPPPPVLTRVLAADGIARIGLHGLSLAELATLAAQDGEGSTSPVLLARIHAHTDGNPLYARALIAELAYRQSDESGPGFPLPAPAAYAAGVSARVAGCRDDTQRFVRALSVLGGGASLEAVGALSAVRNPALALDEAVAAELLRPAASTDDIAFTHPLTRSAVYHELGMSERAELHAKAASITDDTAAAINHRIVAAMGRDAALSAEASALAGAHLGRGAADLAYETFLAASRLAVDDDQREHCLVDAFECLLAIGDLDAATTFLENTARFANVARRSYVEGCVALISGRRYEAAELLRAVWDEPDAPSVLRGRAAMQLATYFVNQGRSADVLLWVDRASSLPPEATPPWALFETARLIGLAQAGRIAEALAESDAFERAVDARERTLDSLTGRGVVRKWADRLSDARADLGFVYESTRREGPLSLSLLALVHLTEAEYRAGAWDAAISHGALAVSIIRDSNQLWLMGMAHAYAALPLAGRGLFDDASASVAIARQSAVALDDAAVQTFSSTAAAWLAHAQNDADGIERALRPLLSMGHVDGLDEPGVSPWRSLLAEALVRLGRLEEAEDVLLPLEALARQRARPSRLVAAARVRGLLEFALGRHDEADEAFAAGAELAPVIGLPFESALFFACYGSYLRRTRRRTRAAEALRAARSHFEMLGATPYLVLCDRELVAATGKHHTNEARSTEALTPQELAVAHLVAAGMTNREIAAELVVSVKTVEYHLSKTYTKLGIRTRTQLVTLLASRS